jgi:hypothetical protein
VTDPQLSGAADPLTEFTAELAELKTRAEEVQNRVRAATATVSAPDGAATVTVGPGGALVNIAFTTRAYQRPPQALASLVLSLIGRGQRQVSAQVTEAFAGIVGEDSAAMDVLTEFLPADPEAENQMPQPVPEPEEPGAPASPPPGSRSLPSSLPPSMPPSLPQSVPPVWPQSGPPEPPRFPPHPPRPTASGPASRPVQDDEDDFTDPW